MSTRSSPAFIIRAIIPFLVLFLQVFHNGYCATDDKCTKWTEMATQLTGSGKYQSCLSSPAPNCTRLDCSGGIHFSNLPIALKDALDINLKYCFGIQLNSCNDPISMDFYLVLPEKNVKFDTRVTGDKALEIPNFHVPLGPIGKAAPVINFEFEKLDNNNIKISIISKVKLYTMGTSIFLDELQRTLVDEETIHAPPCENKVYDASPNPPEGFIIKNCHEIKDITTPKSVEPHSEPPNPPASKTLNTTCDLISKVCSQGEMCDLGIKTCTCKLEWTLRGDVCVTKSRLNLTCNSKDNCGFNEDCQALKLGDKLVCACEDGSGYDYVQKMCMRGQSGSRPTPSPPAVPTPAAGPHTGEHTQPDSQPSKHLPVIIGGTVGGVLGLCLIITVNILVFRRYKRRLNREPGGGLLGDSDAPLLGIDDDNDLIM